MLLIDVGNTGIKWAMVDSVTDLPGQWCDSGVATHAQWASLEFSWRRWKVRHVLISNVAGDQVQERLKILLHKMFGHELQLFWFASRANLGGLQNAYQDPTKLGTDRFAAALAARSLFPQQELLIVSCGTATTIDVVTAEGVFGGGMILPGLQLMAASLANHTAQLPYVTYQSTVDDWFADHAEAAIQNGCIHSQVAAIERAFTLRRNQARCIVTGGAVDQITRYVSIPYEKIDNLVLMGLQIAAKTDVIA